MRRVGDKAREGDEDQGFSGRPVGLSFFRVSGSMRREYVFHGLGGDEGQHFSLRNEHGDIKMGPEQPGTLAGPDTSYAEQPGYGFLKNVARCPHDEVLLADWQSEGPGSPGLRLMGGSGRELITARGEGRGVLGMSPWDRYLLVRSEPEAGADSLFAGVIEPYGLQPAVEEVSPVDMGVGSFEAAGLRVVTRDRVDYFFSALEPGQLELELSEGELRFDGEFAWVAFRNGSITDGMLINGSALDCGALSLAGPGPAHGVIETVDREAPALIVRWKTPRSESLPGPYLIVDGEDYSITSSYEPGVIEPLSEGRSRIQLRVPEVMEIGRGAIEAIDGRCLRLAQLLPKAMIRGLYDRKPIYGSRGGRGVVESADDFNIVLSEGAESFAVGESVIIEDAKAGDLVSVPSVLRLR